MAGACEFQAVTIPSANEHPYDARSYALGEMDGFLGGTGFLSSWLGDDNDSDPQRQGVHWVAIAGPAIAFMISRGFWAGAGVRVARALR